VSAHRASKSQVRVILESSLTLVWLQSSCICNAEFEIINPSQVVTIWHQSDKWNLLGAAYFLRTIRQCVTNTMYCAKRILYYTIRYYKIYTVFFATYYIHTIKWYVSLYCIVVFCISSNYLWLSKQIAPEQLPWCLSRMPCHRHSAIPPCAARWHVAESNSMPDEETDVAKETDTEKSQKTFDFPYFDGHLIFSQTLYS